MRSRKEVMGIPLGKFGLLLLFWGAATSLLVLVSYLVLGLYSPSEAPDISAQRILFASVILVTIVVGALGAATYIAHKA